MKKAKKAGGIVIGITRHRLSQPDVYMTAGGIGLSVGLASQSVEKGIKSGALALFTIVTYSVVHCIPIVIEGVKELED